MWTVVDVNLACTEARDSRFSSYENTYCSFFGAPSQPLPFLKTQPKNNQLTSTGPTRTGNQNQPSNKACKLGFDTWTDTVKWRNEWQRLSQETPWPPQVQNSRRLMPGAPGDQMDILIEKQRKQREVFKSVFVTIEAKQKHESFNASMGFMTPQTHRNTTFGYFWVLSIQLCCLVELRFRSAVEAKSHDVKKVLPKATGSQDPSSKDQLVHNVHVNVSGNAPGCLEPSKASIQAMLWFQPL